MTAVQSPWRMIQRAVEIFADVNITASASTSDLIDARPYAGGSVYVPSGSSLTQLDLYGALNKSDTPVVVYDVDGLAVSITVAAGRLYVLPDELFKCAWITLVGNAAGTLDLMLIG